MTDFSKLVIHHIGLIPVGQISTYKQIAALAGKPQGARGVSWILNSSSKKHNLPWHRVLGSSGKISFPAGSRQHNLQKKLLLKEGIIFSESGRIDFKKFQWKKKPKKVATPGPKMFTYKLT